MRRTRGLTVNVTSTVSSRIDSRPAAQNAQYASCRTNVSAAAASSTQPQSGQNTFQDRSNMPIRAA